jgi:glycogen synthase
MKILQVCPRYYPSIGGVETHVKNISERLAEKHDISVLATDFSGKLPKLWRKNIVSTYGILVCFEITSPFTRLKMQN